jgi:hypothetical protein
LMVTVPACAASGRARRKTARNDARNFFMVDGSSWKSVD